MTGHSRPPEIPVGMPSEVLERRPDISQVKYLLKAQTENIGIAEALRFPSISLTGTLGVASTEIGSVTVDGGVWSVGGGSLALFLILTRTKDGWKSKKKRQSRFYSSMKILC